MFWVVDNGSSHRRKKAADRLTAAFPNTVLVHTPVHASWLNQVEIFFSVVQRKVVAPHDFTDLAQVGTAQPFQWKFPHSDLDDLLARLDRHTADHPEESSVAPAA
ncbi:transposase [Streptomyces sp. NPDC087851]|uniref:transposase n=1 Tax=Streptomyces sp. NPDC087851 TaxID=3365810 RepID=UPI00382275B8